MHRQQKQIPPPGQILMIRRSFTIHCHYMDFRYRTHNFLFHLFIQNHSLTTHKTTTKKRNEIYLLETSLEREQQNQWMMMVQQHKYQND